MLSIVSLAYGRNCFTMSMQQHQQGKLLHRLSLLGGFYCMKSHSLGPAHISTQDSLMHPTIVYIYIYCIYTQWDTLKLAWEPKELIGFRQEWAVTGFTEKEMEYWRGVQSLKHTAHPRPYSAPLMLSKITSLAHLSAHICSMLPPEPLLSIQSGSLCTGQTKMYSTRACIQKDTG